MARRDGKCNIGFHLLALGWCKNHKRKKNCIAAKRDPWPGRAVRTHQWHATHALGRIDEKKISDRT